MRGEIQTPDVLIDITPDALMDIKGYHIGPKIGEGAMASVFLAEQESLGRQVALKVLTPVLAAQPGFTERFLKEGKIIAYLKHPQIVNVYDLGNHCHEYYLAMEYLSGGTLEQKIKTGLTTAQSIRLIRKISEALSFAHSSGVIHRDIKSQNIMFRNDDIPVLTDFGIARLMDDDSDLTIPGRTIGSPHYMSPEQISGRKLDIRADLYSVGILFFKMLTNKLPYRAKEFVSIALMHKTAPVPILPEDLSSLQPVLNKLLAKDPAQRYSNAQEFVDALSRIETNYPDLNQDTSANHCQLQPTAFASVAKNRNMQIPTQAEAKSSGETVYDGIHVLEDDQQNQVLNSQSPNRPKGRARGRRKIFSVWAGAALVLSFCMMMAGKFFFQSTATLPRPAATVFSINKADSSLYEGQGGGPAPDKKIISNNSGVKKDDLAESTATLIEKHNVVEQEIERLMTKARKQLASYNLTSPPGDNCYETYQQLLSLDSSGNAAATILAQIGKAYYRLALAEKHNGRLRQALSYTVKGIELFPEDSVLRSLQSDLRTQMAKAEQIRKEQEQAKQIEQQKIKREAQLAAIEKIRKENLKIKVKHNLAVDQKPEPPLEDQLVESLNLDKEVVAEPEMEKKKKSPEPVKKDVVRKKRLFGTF